MSPTGILNDPPQVCLVRVFAGRLLFCYGVGFTLDLVKFLFRGDKSSGGNGYVCNVMFTHASCQCSATYREMVLCFASSPEREQRERVSLYHQDAVRVFRKLEMSGVYFRATLSSLVWSTHAIAVSTTFRVLAATVAHTLVSFQAIAGRASDCLISPKF